MEQEHGSTFVNCPYCENKNVTSLGDEVKCKHCCQSFHITPTGILPGFRIKCRNDKCLVNFYTERVGRLKCPGCDKEKWYTSKNIVAH
jgi:transposase-like protein